MKKLGVIALVVATTAFGAMTADVQATSSSAQYQSTSSRYDNGPRSGDRPTVEDDPYTVLKPWIGTYSHVVRANSRFTVQLDGFESRERVKVTIDSKSYNVRVWRSGGGYVKIRAPRTAGQYEIVAVGRSSGAEASTTIKVRQRRR